MQIDDLFIESDMWDVNANSDTTGLRYRLDGTDFQNIVNWQNAHPEPAELRELPAGVGVQRRGSEPGDLGGRPADAERRHADAGGPQPARQNFSFVNHTLTHANLDAISYADAVLELSANHQWALDLGFTNYDAESIVQPDISGLTNPNFHQAAYDFGIRYFISDASRPEWANPTPNAGFYSQFQPQILIIPRRANNLFYSLRTPTEWVDEYNWFYWTREPVSPHRGRSGRRSRPSSRSSTTSRTTS